MEDNKIENENAKSDNNENPMKSVDTKPIPTIDQYSEDPEKNNVEKRENKK